MSFNLHALQQELEAIEQRLTQYDQPRAKPVRTRRGWLFALAILGLVIGANMTLVWPVPVDGQVRPDAAVETNVKEIICREFRLVDSQGKTRLHMGAADEGGFVKLLGSEGQTLCGLYEAPAGGRMTFFNAAGHAAVSLGAAKEGGYLAMADAAGKPRLCQYISEEGSAYLSLLNADEKEIVGLGAVAGGGGAWVSGNDGKPRVAMMCDKTDQSGLVWVFGPDSMPRALVSSNNHGGSFHLFRGGQENVPTVNLGCTADGGELEMDAANGADSVWLQASEMGGGLSTYGVDGKVRAYFGADATGRSGMLRLFHGTDQNLAYVGASNGGTGGLFKLSARDGESRVELGIDKQGAGYGVGYDRSGKALRWMR